MLIIESFTLPPRLRLFALSFATAQCGVAELTLCTGRSPCKPGNFTANALWQRKPGLQRI
jgi:hypothetical protein